MNVGEVTVKVLPDLSEFAARLCHEMSLDDPLAKEIMAATTADGPPDVRAVVGDRAFALHSWSLLAADDLYPQRLATCWMGPL